MDRVETELANDGPLAAGAPPWAAAPRLPRPVRGVVFDLDGTLLETEQPYRAAFFAALAELGWSLPDARYAALVGLPSTARRGLLPQMLGPSFPVDAFFGAYRRHRAAALVGGVPLKQGASALLDRLDASGLPYGAATSASAATARANLASAGLLHRFATLVTRDDVARGKPAPDSFLRAAQLLGEAPQNCLAVEDSAAGVAAAHAAGMMVALIPDALPPTQEMLGRAAALANLDELAALLGPAGELTRKNNRSPLRV